MASYVIKRGGIWSGGKLLSEGATVELSDADRDAMDPQHTDLLSANEAKAEASKLKAEADALTEKAKNLTKKEGGK